MKKKIMLSALIVAFVISILVVPVFAPPLGTNRGFVHGIIITMDGVDYYLAGAPDGPGGAVDVPGHYWVLAGKNQLVGKHYNSGPFGAPQWWSSDAADGELLYVVHARIDTWSAEKAERYASRGYTHYHELITVSGGLHHPTLVVWLKHTARTSFTLDGGPAPALSHSVTQGVDYDFIPNYFVPYVP
jgi:selenium-binding protein 1